jgi:hypothetical protein
MNHFLVPFYFSSSAINLLAVFILKPKICQFVDPLNYIMYSLCRFNILLVCVLALFKTYHS